MRHKPPQDDPRLEGRLSDTVAGFDGDTVVCGDCLEGLRLPLLRRGLQDFLNKQRRIGAEGVYGFDGGGGGGHALTPKGVGW